MLEKVAPRNVGTVDRALRVLLGLALLSLVFLGPRTTWGLLGLLPLTTGLVGTCPLYTLLGIGTRPLGTRLEVSLPVRMTWLRAFLRMLSAGYLAAFIPWITLILLNAPVLAPGGRLAPLLRFQPYNAPYESMMAAIHVVWAIMLWRAADDPARHLLFIDFTAWASAAHGLVMLVATPTQKGLAMTFVEGLPLFMIAAALWWLRPRRSGRERLAAGAGWAAPRAAALAGRHGH